MSSPVSECRGAISATTPDHRAAGENAHGPLRSTVTGNGSTPSRTPHRCRLGCRNADCIRPIFSSHRSMIACSLLIALGTGSAYAANTVFSADIDDGEVKTADLGTNAVRSTKIRNEQVLNQDLGVGAVNSASVLEESLHANDLFGILGRPDRDRHQRRQRDRDRRQLDRRRRDRRPLHRRCRPRRRGGRTQSQTRQYQRYPKQHKRPEIGRGHLRRPRNWRGYRVSGAGGTDPNVAIREDLPSRHQRVEVTALATSGTPVWSLRVYALCAL